MTHSCGKTRNGKFTIRRQTSRKSLAKVLERTKRELRKRMHDDIHLTGRWLSSVVRGHDEYFAFPCNWEALNSFRRALQLWRRSQKARRRWTWGRFLRFSDRYIPPPKLRHPYPSVRIHACNSSVR